MKKVITICVFLYAFIAVSAFAQQTKVVVVPLGGKSPTKCVGHPQWQPVDCTTTFWVWSSHRSLATTLDDANFHRVLWVGDQHFSNVPTTCSLDGTGSVSTQTFTMSGCDTDWYHIGGSFTGNCGGHDGDTVRMLVTGDYDCFDY